MKSAYFYDTMLGKILIAEDGKGITSLRIIPEEGINAPDPSRLLNSSYTVCETELLNEAAGQLKEYLEGKRNVFDIKLNPAGTPFMQSVWEALRAIPYGQVRSYAQVAEAIGNPKACRAVGTACHNNPVLLMIPCHRVIGSDGSLTGFAAGLEIKRQLLGLEQERSNRI
jgi:methylated-DNA-[protein]-cysteine S-methyltransferase